MSTTKKADYESTVTLPSKGILYDGIPAEVSLRGMTTREEKILYASQGGNVFHKILKNCIVEPENITSPTVVISVGTVEEILSEEKPNQKEKLNIQRERIDRFFPKNFSEKQKEDLIVQLLESWYKKRQREQER